MRQALEATPKYNGRLQDVPTPLNDDQKARIKALRAATTAEEMYVLAKVADVTCSIEKEEP